MKWSDDPPPRPLWWHDEPTTPKGLHSEPSWKANINNFLWGVVIGLGGFVVLATIVMWIWLLSNSWVWRYF